jgi:hypothetical protein
MISRPISWLVAASVVAAAARAAVAADAAPAHDPSTPAPELIGDAVAEYDAGHFEEARVLFRLAHEKAPTARTLRGIGMTSFELRDYVDATRALAASLQDQRRPLTDEQRHQVEELLARAESFVGRFQPRVHPADATLIVDGKPIVREADGAVLLPFGHHRITARCPSCLPSERDVDVEVLGGEKREIEISLDAAPPPVGLPAASPSGAAAGGPPTIERRDDTGGGSSAPLVWGSAAAAAVVGATASAIWWGDRAHELDTCRAAGERCKNESTVEGQRNLAVGMTLGLGAAAITTGIVATILWRHQHAGSSTSSGAVACAGGKGTVSCAIRF